MLGDERYSLSAEQILSQSWQKIDLDSSLKAGPSNRGDISACLFCGATFFFTQACRLEDLGRHANCAKHKPQNANANCH